MKYKKIMFMLVLAVFLLSITCVSASEIDDTLASEDTNTIGLSVDKDIIEENLQTSEENEALASTDYDEAIAQTDTEVLGADSATYFDLAEEIRHSGNITLTHKNYTYNEGAKAITISEDNKFIDGNGAVIDMNESTIRAFDVIGNGVTIKNLTIKNVNFWENGGAIKFAGNSGAVINCNFINNTAQNGGAIYFDKTGNVTNCNFTDNTANYGGSVFFNLKGTVTNCNFTGNTATYYGGAVYFDETGTVTNCNFTDNIANDDGGAVYFSGNGEVTNCNFTNNTAKMGNAIYINNKCTISDCDFTNNPITKGAIHSVTGDITLSNNIINVDDVVSDKNFTEIQKLIDQANDGDEITINGLYAGFGIPIRITKSLTLNGQNNTTLDAKKLSKTLYITANNVIIKNIQFTSGYAECGGAIYFLDQGTVTNCNFTGNTATGDGGAVYFNSNGEVTNCNFTNNSATENGGAVYFNETGTMSNCNFTGNTATKRGGAVCFDGTGTMSNCNFTGNTATGDGGAVYFDGTGTAINCNFTGNTATGDYKYGGAVYFQSTGNVKNCNFTGNSAVHGGAVYFYSTGNVSNCNFTDNTATYGGGAIRMSSGTVTNCSFADNHASGNGGAIRMFSGSVENCNFTGNNATTGSAIYFYNLDSSDTLTVSDSTFLNNRANAEYLDVVKNDDNITITFTGRNNLLNAIYSSNDAEVTFTNVTYWGANGTATVSATMSGSNNATGQNITVGVVVNGKVVLNEVKVTDENGMIVLPIKIESENYCIGARHDKDSYYTEAEKTISNNMKFSVNVTSQTANNRTVNITAKSDIWGNFMPGKLLFILPNGTQINATYGTNGTWWAVHTFDAYGEYKVNASYVGLDNVTVNDGTITINKVNSTIILDNIVLDYGETKNVTVTTTGATGITAKIDGNDVTVINNYTIQIPVLDARTYNLTVTTIPDYDHNPVTKEVNITVNKVNSTLTVSDIVFDYGSSGSTVVSLTGADGVNATVVGQPKTVVKVNGTNITVSDLDAGTYTLTVTAIADKNHNNITKNATITVNKVNATLTVNDIVLDYGESKNITVTTEGATGITAKIDGVNVTVNNYTIPISGLGAGNYTLTVTTIPDDNHNPVTKEANITVNKLSTEIILANETLDLKVGDEVPVLVNLTPAGAGNLTFTSSDEDLVFVEDNVTIVANSQGQAIITVSFAGDENYTAAENKTITVNVALNDASVSVENDTLNLKVDETYKINATKHPDTIMLDITYKSSDNSVASVDKNGIVTAISEGTAIITLEVGDNEIYAKNSTTVTVNVKDNTVNVSASDLTKYYNGPESFVVIVTDSKNNPLANQSVIINVAGVNYTRTTDANGTASIAISLISGQYNVTTIVNNNTVYSKVTVLPTVNATDLVKVFRNATQFYATFKDSQGNYLADGTMVRFNINGVMYDRKISGNNGLAKLNINLEQGQYIITSMNLETGENAANNVTVISRLIENKELVKYYRNATQYTVKVIGDDGNPVGAGESVTFNINGVMYTRQTNGSGIAKLNINLHPGDYIITAEYKDCRVSNNIKVLPVLTADDLTKKYGTPDQFIATLVDGQGNPFAGETVQFNVNGIFYNRVTDSNGQSKLNIRLMPGKYVITSSYNGTNIANTITISA